MTTAARAEGLTREDLDAMPTVPGWRYELIDGVILVSASPARVHQEIVGNLHLLFRSLCPPELQVLLAPFDVALSERVVVIPDLIVARRSDLTAKDLPGAPRLAVEVHSPSTRWVDLGEKKRRYAEAGCPSYWVVEPGGGRAEPAVTAYELTGDGYVDVAHVTGAESWSAARPFPVTIVPNDLLDS